MVATDFLESDLELVVLEWFQGLGYETLYARNRPAKRGQSGRRSTTSCSPALRDAIDRLNPQSPQPRGRLRKVMFRTGRR